MHGRKRQIWEHQEAETQRYAHDNSSIYLTMKENHVTRLPTPSLLYIQLSSHLQNKNFCQKF